MGVLLHLQAYSVLEVTFFFYLFSLNQVNAQKQKGQTVDSTSALKAINILKVVYFFLISPKWSFFIDIKH